MRGVPRLRRASSHNAVVLRLAASAASRSPAGSACSDSRRVELEVLDDAEAAAHRAGQQPDPRRRADQRERLERDRHRPRVQAGVDASCRSCNPPSPGRGTPRRRRGRRWISSMNSTSPVAQPREDADSGPPPWSAPGRASTWTCAPTSLAMTCASVVLPSPGGPCSRMCSTGSLAPCAASTAILSLSQQRFLPDVLREPRAQRVVEAVLLLALRLRWK